MSKEERKEIKGLRRFTIGVILICIVLSMILASTGHKNERSLGRSGSSSYYRH